MLALIAESLMVATRTTPPRDTTPPSPRTR